MGTVSRVLIFGIDSFTGKYVKDELQKRGYMVYGTAYPGGSPVGDFIPCDITNSLQTEEIIANVEPDYVIILAAITFVPHGQDRSIYDINLFAPLSILRQLSKLSRKPRRIIIPSTGHIYGNATGGALSETCCANPVSHYALSKYALEQMCNAYQENLDIVILRPFNYTGIGQAGHFLIPKLVESFRNRLPCLELGNLDVYRDFSDVRDVARAYSVLLETDDLQHRVYNVCSGEAVCLRQILDWLRQMADFSPQVRINPDFVRKNEMRQLYGNNERLLSLGWQRQFCLKDTLRWMLTTC
ncbi:NAD-dependent epimerase/dehydratase [Desulfurispirillum indicum S5]|uniref:NAD-dependent epimerase/dehydratase n=1 Tax=Desulfurispirillum indicum (strain ATCC BAA-1389 / DSM 22839 / S5) TaxID=653733 RepID=E6W629_DESIS|nr:NAD-dependent epimerase/dehydratase family protein [Desulfurispirillum indicum]ADU64968.1 NAD-dependent epimerase/dehydratase [Desulfurispirillum indicum S5]